MSRKIRINRPTSFYHVMLRGNNGQNIFFSDYDRCKLCLILQEGIERYGHRIHAFCFMSNHIHLVIQVGKISLSQIVKHIAMCYAIYINRTHDRVGHLFQGRFKAILVDAKNYLPELVRYIHLNPVRAGIVKTPEMYVWSGHLAYLKTTKILWLTEEYILQHFHKNEDSARENYCAYVNKGIGVAVLPEIRFGTRKGRILGDDTFIRDVLASEKNRVKQNIELAEEQLIQVVSEVFNVPIQALKGRSKLLQHAKARAVAAFLTREYQKLSIASLAKLLEKNPNALSRAATSVEKLILRDPQLEQMISRLREKLTDSRQDYQIVGSDPNGLK